MSSESPPPNTPYERGDLLAGRYRIDGLLGEGGFSMVFAAEDSHLGRRVAAKVLCREVRPGEETRKRFEREAQLVSKLSSPHTVRLFDFGQTEAGDPFLVLELIDGETLQERIERGPLHTDHVVEIVRQVLQSLREAHDAGIIHRDLKPSNIMLYEEYGEIQAKVLDFGVAGLLAWSPEQADSLTSKGMVLGTVGYMSPEQALGQKLTAAADIFALGVVALEAISGTNPLRQHGRSPLKLHLTRERLSIPEEAALSQPLRDALNGMLVADVSKRFSDGGEALAAVEAAAVGATLVTAVGEPTEAPDSPDPVEAREIDGKPYLLAVVAAVLSAGVLAALFVVARPAASPPPEPSPQPRATVEMEEAEPAIEVPKETEDPAPVLVEADDSAGDAVRDGRQNVAIAVEVARLRSADRAELAAREERRTTRRKPRRRPSKSTKSTKSKPAPSFDVELVGEGSK